MLLIPHAFYVPILSKGNRYCSKEHKHLQVLIKSAKGDLIETVEAGTQPRKGIVGFSWALGNKGFPSGRI